MKQLLERLESMKDSIDVSGVDFLAVQFNVKDEGVFYVEIKNGGINIAPYEYNDRSCAITIKKDNLIKLIDGKLDAVAAFTLGKLKVDGDIGKALEFSHILKNRK